jgi:outer membrane protein OmpA-like peptidoglycan-associated protein
MNKLSSFAALVTVALIGIATESAWSDAATSNGSAKPAVQTPAPTTGAAQGWYPPPNRGGYPRPWQQPPQWSVPPQGYGQSPPHYPPRGPYQAVPAAAAVNPLSVEFKQMQEQLTAKSTELDMAHVMLEQLRGTLQHSLAAERALREMVADITSEQQALQARVTELTAALNTTTATLEQQRQQITNDQEQNRTLTAERDRLRDDLASRDKRLATVQVELQAATQTLQQTQSETSTAGQQLSEVRSQAETFNNELTELKAQLESQKTTLLNAEQTLAAEIDERDGLHANLAACKQELTQTQATLTDAQSVEDALRQAPPTAAGVVVSFAPDGPDKAVEPAASEGFDAGIAEVAAPQTTTTDTDGDGVPDSIDLCPETQHGIAVESTGCAAGVAINLDGVNFFYNSHELTDEARGILDRVADIIIQQPELRLEVAGHTDATGNPTYNQELSMQRAETVRDYLVTQGANPRYIGAAGYGGQRPIADNTTPEGLEKNRRVELRVLQ